MIGLGLGSCVGPTRPPAAIPPATPPASALEAGVRRGPSLRGLDAAGARRAWRAFRISCPSLVAREDASGLTRPEDWREVCAAEPDDAVRFIRRNFETVEVGDGAAFATGYYEPEIAGSRTRQPGYDVPVYRKPPDLLDANSATGARGRGRVDEAGNYVLYHDRAAIEEGALAGRGLELAWAADPVDLFFLQIQGSGRLRLPDGTVMRIGYAGQNGREYVAIGRLLRDRSILQPPISMQRIREWIRANPDAGRALMRENPSYVFFQELTGPGPLGALGRPVTPNASVAADPKFVPLGAPVLLTGMDNPRANGLWVAQDTGGAIRGPNRFDTFWGAGEEAAGIAGSMQSRGRAYLLLPRGALDRIRRRAPPQR
ncbi:MAG: rane-bound lytic murein transglycosylase [Sphingomonadales bacterium]|nr:rane-bound lytic murein transglycosylase [Sphingomonadales bacterium]